MTAYEAEFRGGGEGRKPQRVDPRPVAFRFKPHAEFGHRVPRRPAHECGPRSSRGLPDGSTVEADRDQLRRVLTNLALNAYQAGARTVRVGARLDDDSVTIAANDRDGGAAPA